MAKINMKSNFIISEGDFLLQKGVILIVKWTKEWAITCLSILITVIVKQYFRLYFVIFKASNVSVCLFVRASYHLSILKVICLGSVNHRVLIRAADQLLDCLTKLHLCLLAVKLRIVVVACAV